ncbi:MAG TPA: DUF4190 domain-containing protein [Micromonosporaceae bacterium]|nr:DUF4190 domain-containing protein [Micromonosporaceae bacterium]HCU49836.1 DUF4190 domain-containing protein [Micromonosporaceae bacterium]
MSYPPPGGQDPYQPLPPPEPESNPYAQATPPPAYQPYDQPYSQYPVGATPVAGNNGLAIGSMVTGIVSILLACCCSPLGIIGGGTAVVLGVIGMNQIKERGQTNRGMAIAGIATGGVAVLLGIILFIAGFAMNSTDFLNNYDWD